MSALRTVASLNKPFFILVTETWCSWTVFDRELNIQNYPLCSYNWYTKRGGGCLIYALDSPTTNKVVESVLCSLRETVWMSVNTLNQSLILRCIYWASNSSDNVDTFIINELIHASALNSNDKFIVGNFNYTGINWNTGSDQSFLAVTNMHF